MGIAFKIHYIIAYYFLRIWQVSVRYLRQDLIPEVPNVAQSFCRYFFSQDALYWFFASGTWLSLCTCENNTQMWHCKALQKGQQIFRLLICIAHSNDHHRKKQNLAFSCLLHNVTRWRSLNSISCCQKCTQVITNNGKYLNFNIINNKFEACARGLNAVKIRMITLIQVVRTLQLQNHNFVIVTVHKLGHPTTT